MKLTKNEQAVYELLVESWRGNSCAVAWVDDCRPASMPPRSYPGVIASLRKKGLIVLESKAAPRKGLECFLPGVK